MEALAGLKISAKQVQLITERVGQRLVKERTEATAAFFAPGPPKRPAPAHRPGLLVISADGGRLQTLQDDPPLEWKEDKVAMVYEVTATPERPGVQYQGPKPIGRSMVATMEPWDTLGDIASTLADQRGYLDAKQVLFISDGATGIRTLRQRCFPQARFILDWKHATDHLYEVSQAAFGPTDKARTWLDLQKDRLWNGRVHRILADLRKQAQRLGPPKNNAPDNDPRRVVAQNVEYFKTNREAMDYPTFRKKGWPLGSGIVESAIKQLGKRMTGLEKHWSISGAEQTLQVITSLLSEDSRWDDFWKRGACACVA